MRDPAPSSWLLYHDAVRPVDAGDLARALGIATVLLGARIDAS